MEIRVKFPGQMRVDADVDGRIVKTDQSVVHGGDGTAPEPFDLFLASIATCAGAYVRAFCKTRGIPMDGIELVQTHRMDEESHRLVCVDLELTLPATFPEKYRAAVVKAAEGCKVKKALASPPDVGVTLHVAEESSAPAA